MGVPMPSRDFVLVRCQVCFTTTIRLGDPPRRLRSCARCGSPYEAAASSGPERPTDSPDEPRPPDVDPPRSPDVQPPPSPRDPRRAPELPQGVPEIRDPSTIPEIREPSTVPGESPVRRARRLDAERQRVALAPNP